MLEWAIIAGVAVLVLFGSVGSLRKIRTRLRDELARMDPGGAGLRRDMSLIEQVKALAQHAQRVTATVGPATFGDPLAARVEWKPASPGGTNIRTRKLVEVAPGRLELRPSAGILVFGGVFLVIGLGVMAIGVVPMWTRGFELSPEQLMPGLMGLVFASVGAALIYFSARPVVFDRASGRFWDRSRAALGDRCRERSEKLPPARRACAAAAWRARARQQEQLLELRAQSGAARRHAHQRHRPWRRAAIACRCPEAGGKLRLEAVGRDDVRGLMIRRCRVSPAR
jgi:hypothetical protein